MSENQNSNYLGLGLVSGSGMGVARLAPLLVLTSALALVLPTFGPAAIHSPSAQSDDDGFVPVTDAMLEDPAPGDWLTWRRTPNGWGYGISAITTTSEENDGVSVKSTVAMKGPSISTTESSLR